MFPQEADAYYFIGLNYEYRPKFDYDNTMNDFDSALKWYEKALQNNFDNHLYHYKIGLLYLERPKQ